MKTGKKNTGTIAFRFRQVLLYIQTKSGQTVRYLVGVQVISDKVNLDVIFEAKNMGCSYNLPNLRAKQEGSMLSFG